MFFGMAWAYGPGMMLTHVAYDFFLRAIISCIPAGRVVPAAGPMACRFQLKTSIVEPAEYSGSYPAIENSEDNISQIQECVLSNT